MKRFVGNSGRPTTSSTRCGRPRCIFASPGFVAKDYTLHRQSMPEAFVFSRLGVGIHGRPGRSGALCPPGPARYHRLCSPRPPRIRISSRFTAADADTNIVNGQDGIGRRCWITEEPPKAAGGAIERPVRPARMHPAGEAGLTVSGSIDGQVPIVRKEALGGNSWCAKPVGSGAD